jgi:hypothetical protein
MLLAQDWLSTFDNQAVFPCVLSSMVVVLNTQGNCWAHPKCMLYACLGDEHVLANKGEKIPYKNREEKEDHSVCHAEA